MPRACVIVLDAVGAGELPDAAEWGDEGSDTLGNVARAVGGLDLPNLEALGLGNVEPLEGCPPQPGAPAVAGRLLERSKGKDTTTGHWELMGVVTAVAFPTYPYGFPDDVIDPFMNRTGARRALQQAGLGDGGHPGVRRGAPEDGEVDRLHVCRLGLPDRRARGDDPARGALRRLSRGARDPHGQARRRARHRPSVHRGCPDTTSGRPNRHDFSLEPRRPNYLTRDPGRRAHDVRRREDLATSSPAATSTSRSRRSRTSTASTARSSCSRTSTTGLVFTNLVETDQLWGHRNDPVNFHRCLQDFDRRLPDILEALREGDLLIITSDHGCDPTTPSSDHSREHALLLAYAAGRNAAGRIHEDGEFGDVGATVCAWLGAKHPGKGAPGTPIIEP